MYQNNTMFMDATRFISIRRIADSVGLMTVKLAAPRFFSGSIMTKEEKMD